MIGSFLMEKKMKQRKLNLVLILDDIRLSPVYLISMYFIHLNKVEFDLQNVHCNKCFVGIFFLISRVVSAVKIAHVLLWLF